MVYKRNVVNNTFDRVKSTFVLFLSRYKYFVFVKHKILFNSKNDVRLNMDQKD